MSIQKNFKANGKLLLTGEYLVMEGAQALALPLVKGQQMQVNSNTEELLNWEAWSPDGLWFKSSFALPEISIVSTSDHLLAKKLKEILTEALKQTFFKKNRGFDIKTILDFNPAFGFGSSATLVALLAQWLGLDAFGLHHKIFGGSGYDIACATASGPIIYSIEKGVPKTQPIDFFPSFHHQLYFVYLGSKQHSAREIARFKDISKVNSSDIEQVNQLTEIVCNANRLEDFERALRAHEALLSGILKRTTIQEERFPLHEGVVKSLGAWGGDFVLVTTKKEKSAFVQEMKQAGYEVVYSFADMVLSHTSKKS
ncbi:MAG: GYDIA family GHMP kinase [Bacteroidales bacterium]|nr:GYDIA family GHMP kinase [Bacteroidales bacterium]